MFMVHLTTTIYYEWNCELITTLTIISLFSVSTYYQPIFLLVSPVTKTNSSFPWFSNSTYHSWIKPVLG